jgi:hypothetical protein
LFCRRFEILAWKWRKVFRMKNLFTWGIREPFIHTCCFVVWEREEGRMEKSQRHKNHSNV